MHPNALNRLIECALTPVPHVPECRLHFIEDYAQALSDIMDLYNRERLLLPYLMWMVCPGPTDINPRLQTLCAHTKCPKLAIAAGLDVCGGRGGGAVKVRVRGKVGVKFD